MIKTAHTIRALTLAIALVVPTAAFAQSASPMEAALSCPNGMCGIRNAVLNAAEPIAQFKRINIFEKDDRLPEVTAIKPHETYSPIGTLTTLNSVPDHRGDLFRGESTAFLVSPCHILTNYHAVFGKDSDGPDEGKDYSTIFAIGKGSAKLSTRATPVAHGRYRGMPGSGDWAVLKLDNCFGERANVGWMETLKVRNDVLLNQDLMLAGYFGDTDFRSPYADPYCKVKYADTDGFKHDCASRAGASGSPIFAVMRDGTPVVVGINAGPRGFDIDGVAKYSDQSANWGVSMSEILATPGIKELLDADEARLPGGNPNRVKRSLIKKQKAEA